MSIALANAVKAVASRVAALEAEVTALRARIEWLEAPERAPRLPAPSLGTLPHTNKPPGLTKLTQE